MAQDSPVVRRTLHFKFTAPSADPQQLLSLVQAAAPFYQWFGGKDVRLLQNADDPGRFIQVIEYEAPADVELNRQRIAGDVRVQAYLQAWRSVAGDAIEIDVYRDVANSS